MSVNEFVEKLLGLNQEAHYDPSLIQGVKFNTLQGNIITNTLPDLPLMEQTSMPGLGSIVESLGNQDSIETPLTITDKKEFKILRKLETEFNQKLSAYVTAYKAHLESIAQPREGGSLQSVKVGQGGTTMNPQLQRLNDELLSISNQMWERTQNLHTTDARLRKAIRKKRAILRNQMHILQNQQKPHQQRRTESNTLSGAVADNRLQLDSAYLQYLVWFFAAFTVAAVALHQIAKNKK